MARPCFVLTSWVQGCPDETDEPFYLGSLRASHEFPDVTELEQSAPAVSQINRILLRIDSRLAVVLLTCGRGKIAWACSEIRKWQREMG